MKEDDKGIGKPARRRDGQPNWNGQVVEGPEPACQVGGGRNLEPPSDQRGCVMLEEPYAEGHGPQQPVGVELGHTREQIDHRDLPAQSPQHPHRYGGAAAGRIAPGVQGVDPVQRHEHHQQQHQAHPVVVVEVRHPVDQLDIREPQKKQHNADPIKQAGRDRQSQQTQADEVHIHAPLRPRPYPAKAQIAEVVFRDHVQIPHPAVGNKAPSGCRAEETDRHPENNGRTAVHLTHARAMQAVQHVDCLPHAAAFTGHGMP